MSTRARARTVVPQTEIHRGDDLDRKVWRFEIVSNLSWVDLPSLRLAEYREESRPSRRHGWVVVVDSRRHPRSMARDVPGQVSIDDVELPEDVVEELWARMRAKPILRGVGR